MASIKDFTSYVSNKGLMRTARYTVIIPYNPGNYGGSTRVISLLCDQVQLPGLNYNTAANASFGETREVPTTRLYDNISLSFFVDNQMLTKKYFDDWLFNIQDPTTRKFNYYANYISNLDILVEDLDDNIKYGITLHEAYPKTISPIQFDYASKDVMKINVSMAYKYWTPMQIAETYNNSIQYLNTNM